jgi:hypothetical protein
MRYHLKKRIGMPRGDTAFTLCGRWVDKRRVFFDKWTLINHYFAQTCIHCLRKMEKFKCVQ